MILSQFPVIALAASLLLPTPADESPRRPPSGPEAWVKITSTSTQPSVGRSIRQRAADGDDTTAFRSASPARAGDHLTFTFDGPAPVRAIAVATGTPDGADALTAGAVEVAEDGTTFAPVAILDPKGQARADLGGKSIRAVRIRVGADLPHPLVVREVRIDADRVRPFRHPVEFTVDTREAPTLQGWAEDTARLCESWYDTLNDVTTLTDAHPSDHINLAFRRGYRGVAAADMARAQITASVRFFTDHPKDRGALIHETVHVIQQYPYYGTRRAPAWLVEGIDDYIRFFVYEPGQAGPIPPRQARFDGSYRITATFLDFVSRTYDPLLIPKLDRDLRAGTYKPELFHTITGKTLTELNDQWRTSMGLPPVAAPGKPGDLGPISREPGQPVGAIQGGEGGAAFRDEAKGRLVRINVGSGEWVDSIASVWNDGQREVKGTTHGGEGGGEDSVELEPGESLLAVSGVIRENGGRNRPIGQEVIGSLSFRTDRRTIPPLGGTTRGRRFTLEAPAGQEVCGFQGRSSTFLNALGLVCRPIPKPDPAAAPAPALAPAR